MSPFAWVMALWLPIALAVGLALGAAVRRNTARTRAAAALPPLPRRQPGAQLDDAGLRRLAAAITREEN